MTELSTTVAPKQPIPRRRLLIASGGALAVAGLAAASFPWRPRRADGLPASANLAAARDIGEGFYIVDGWVLTSEDLQALKSSAPALKP